MQYVATVRGDPRLHLGQQNFSVFKRVLGQQWHGSPAAEERRLVLVLAAASSPPDAELLAAARVIWASAFGVPRKGAPKVMRRLATNTRPEARNATAWLRRRRQAVADQACRAGTGPAACDAAVEAAAEAAWSARHDTEVRHQKAARTEHLRAAVQHGCVAREALGADASQQMLAYQATEAEREHALQARLRRLDGRHRAPPPPDLHGCRVFVDGEARDVLNKTPAQWALARRQGQFTIVEDRAVASVFVTLTPSEPGDRTNCIAAMTGRLICTPELFLNPPGVALRLQCALSWPRHIFLSSGCLSRHKAMVDLIRRVCTLAAGGIGCRWTLYLEADGPDRQSLFLARARKRQAGHLSEMVSLLLPEQIRDAAFQPFPNKKTLKCFLASICKVDARFTRLGLCGR